MKKRVPKLRFPEFNGEWEEKKLGDVTTTFKAGESITAASITISGKYQVYGGNGLRGYTNTYTHDGEYTLIGRQGALCGNIKYVTGRNFISEHAIAVHANEVTNTKYLYFFLDHCDLNKLSESSAQGGLSVNKLIILRYFFPRYEEQKRIADFLSTVDGLIASEQRILDDLQLKKKGLMQKLFSRKLRFKDKDGKEFPEWEEKRLGEVCDKPMYGLNTAAKQYDGMNKYLRITDISEVTHEFLVNDITSPSEFSDAYLLKENDIVFARTGASTGKNYIYNPNDGKIYFAGFLIKFSVKDGNAKYIFYATCTEAYKKWVHEMSVRSGQPGINAQEYASYTIPFPSLLEQKKISDYLWLLDNVIEKQGKVVAGWKQRKKGLLQQMFV
jgi:type I restriction enzyme, S subunit